MFLKNENIIFKIRRSKVTDYAALRSSTLIRTVHIDLKDTISISLIWKRKISRRLLHSKFDLKVGLGSMLMPFEP